MEHMSTQSHQVVKARELLLHTVVVLELGLLWAKELALLEWRKEEENSLWEVHTLSTLLQMIINASL